MDEEGNGLVGAGQVGARVVLLVGGQGIGHALHDGVDAEARHDDLG